MLAQKLFTDFGFMFFSVGLEYVCEKTMYASQTKDFKERSFQSILYVTKL